MFKVGDWVCLKVAYFPSGKVDTVRGVITSKKSQYTPANVIDWEDGSQGDIYLDMPNKYLRLV